MHYGIDCSDDQHISAYPGGEPIDWQRVYAYLRKEGGGTEPFVIFNSAATWLFTDYKGARAAGFRAIGLYHYVTDPTSTSVTAQARTALSQIPDVPVACDYEQQYGRTWDQIHSDIMSFCEVVKGADRKPFVYSDGWFLSSMASFPTLPIWLADPASSPSRPCTLWQKSWTADIPGIPIDPNIGSNCDLDEWMSTDRVFEAFFSLKPLVPKGEAPVNLPVYQKGESGPGIKSLQAALLAQGWGSRTGMKVNGTYDNATDEAVRHFQSGHGIGPCDHFGPESWEKLFVAQAAKTS